MSTIDLRFHDLDYTCTNIISTISSGSLGCSCVAQYRRQSNSEINSMTWKPPKKIIFSTGERFVLHMLHSSETILC